MRTAAGALIEEWRVAKQSAAAEAKAMAGALGRICQFGAVDSHGSSLAAEQGRLPAKSRTGCLAMALAIEMAPGSLLARVIDERSLEVFR